MGRACTGSQRRAHMLRLQVLLQKAEVLSLSSIRIVANRNIPLGEPDSLVEVTI